MTRAILTCSPNFIDLALNEIHRHRPEITVIQHIAPGYIFLQAPYSFDKLTDPWRHQLPIYLHHLFPVHEIVRLSESPDDLTRLRQAVQSIAPPDATLQVSTTFDTTTTPLPEIQQYLNENQLGADAPAGRIVSVLLTQEGTQYRAYLGISWASQNLSPWAGGQIPITEPVSNRAGYKLIEALQTFNIRLRPGDQVLDLGAAPGAWTTLLRRRDLCVTAVAPTPLYPWLMLDAGVIYQPMRAEDYLLRCQTIFDLIVNDMKLDGQESARLMVDYAQHLRREGIAIMTVKLRSRNEQRTMDHSFRILRKAYKIIRVRQLVSNHQEVTLFLRRKS